MPIICSATDSCTASRTSGTRSGAACLACRSRWAPQRGAIPSPMERQLSRDGGSPHTNSPSA
eukprot:8728345-Karenia_brevis.AAC.1